MICDVCGLPDNYRGQGDGIGSCDCPRCDCGTARGSYLCDCISDDECDTDDYDPDYDLDQCQPGRDVATIELPGVSR